MISPQWETWTTNTGAQVNRVAKEGSLFVKIVPANEQGKSMKWFRDSCNFCFVAIEGGKKFNYEGKLQLTLSAVDLGSLLLDIPPDGLVFYRNFGGQQDSGLESPTSMQGAMKSLSVKHMTGGIGFSIREGEKRVNSFATPAEMALFRSLIPNIMNYMLGFDALRDGL